MRHKEAALVAHQVLKAAQEKEQPGQNNIGTKESSSALPTCKCQLPSLHFRRRWGWETLLSGVPPFFTDAQISLIANWRHTTLTYSGIHGFPATHVPTVRDSLGQQLTNAFCTMPHSPQDVLGSSLLPHFKQQQSSQEAEMTKSA